MLVPLAVIVLVAQNTRDVKFKFLWIEAHSPLVVIILGAALAGVMISQIATLLWRGRRRRSIR